MDTMEKFNDDQPVQRVVHPVISAAAEADSPPNLLMPVLRRWHIVLAIAFVISAIGIPAVWLLINPAYTATAAIRVAPVIASILFSDKESEGVLPMYQNFMNTQASLIQSDQVLQRIADDLVDKNLKFFEGDVSPVAKLKGAFKGDVNPAAKLKGAFKGDVNPVAKLKEALVNEVIIVAPVRQSELITLTMKSRDSTEAAQIVDAFVRAYMSIVVSKETEGGDRQLAILESELKVLADELKRQRQTIRQMAEEYGSVALTSRQEMMMQRVADLQSELTKAQTQRQRLQTQQQLLGQRGPQEGSPGDVITGDVIKRRYEFINANPTYQLLSNNITQLNQGLIVATQEMAPTNPELKQKADLLEVLKTRLKEKEDELGKTFDELITTELAQNHAEQLANHAEQLANAEIELTEMTAYVNRLQEMQSAENIETIEVGRKQLAIQDLQEQLTFTKELYDTVQRRIQQLDMERKRPARISVAYNASVAPLPNKRIKFTAALAFGSLAAGCFLAFLLGRADHSLYTPQEITKYIDVRVIGTTLKNNNPATPLLSQQTSFDYQAIRANLGLLNGDGIPNKLVIASPGTHDGKTVFAVNLATSLANAGKKVLLIDGDLRKPDLRHVLDLPKGSRGLQSFLWGADDEKVVHHYSAGFDVLAADSRNAADAFEILSHSQVSKKLDRISEKYDHVIIDTPPVLAFPDALLWAKMADGAIVTSFSGHTSGHDLKETITRLEQINAKVLGTVFQNVSTNESYNRYAYGY